MQLRSFRLKTRRLARTSAALGLALFCAAPASAAPTRKEVNNQGQLADVNGVPLNGNYTIVIELWDAAVGGNLLHTETFPNSPVERGVYNVKLGSTTALPDSVVELGLSGALYKSITVDLGSSVETLGPRQKLSSSLFALNCDKLDGFEGREIGDATYRWAEWSTYAPWYGWYFGNDPSLQGGVHPSNWGNNDYRAVHMAWGSPETFNTLFTRKGYANHNAVVCADEWYYNDSTNSKHCGVVFRIENSTSQAITWTPYFWYTSYSSWNERASVAINGSEVWQSGNNCHCNASLNISVPANKISTVVFVSASAGPSGTRTNLLAFYNNSLNLPAGLRFVDDLDIATNLQ